MKTSVYFELWILGFAVCNSCNPRLRLCWLCSQKAKQSFNWMSKPFLTKSNEDDNIPSLKWKISFSIQFIPWYCYDCITIQVEVDKHYWIISYCCWAHLTPYLWMPKWIEASDPSACTLKHHRTSGTETKNGNLCNIASRNLETSIHGRLKFRTLLIPQRYRNTMGGVFLSREC